ncbi:hypothetical protein PQI07_25840 [Methylobacterium sp. 092160098-2]|uniref:hypothetical protein n=1 Tax=Methylobacterium sp. 092160098-2 TaxID=3025129 RepID=UPI002381AE84|nr:hypothetical protein [Methylobacterium sp. 092160098-2]MDE4914096.1 hypothetical protein [Methylobacterium sp. 092160098-2]
MSKVSLAVLAATKGTIHVHVAVEPGSAFGISFPASELTANLASFERLFQVSPSTRRERNGHVWTMRRLMDGWKAAPSEGLSPEALAMFEKAFANGCVWDAVNDAADPDGARGRILNRLRAGLPAHIRAISTPRGTLVTRILDGDPGDADDVDWTAAHGALAPVVGIEAADAAGPMAIPC